MDLNSKTHIKDEIKDLVTLGMNPPSFRETKE